MRRRWEQVIYWASIGGDVLLSRRPRGVYVLGYVKSGTNWLSHLMSGALGLPILEPWKRNWPTRRPAIYHMHRFIPLESARRRTVYLMRDGRDTMVSAYFHMVRGRAKSGRILERKLGSPLTAENIGENLPHFIRFMRSRSLSGSDYRTHIERWKAHRHQYVTARYEDLLVDTPGELARVLGELTGGEVDPERIEQTVAAHDFAGTTGRKPGEGDDKAFLRKGISGDWRNYFSREAAAVFDEYAGDLLVELGYEADRAWVNTLSDNSSSGGSKSESENEYR